MKQYLELLERTANTGELREDRTGTGTSSIFGQQMVFNLKDGFPLLTTKHIPFKLVASELLWFIDGGCNGLNINDLKMIHPNNTIWDEWADDDGGLGPIYGSQWRYWPATKPNPRSIDQLQDCIDSLKNDPHGRRHIVSSWNPGEIEYMALPPCHMMFQFYVSNDGLSCQMYQRSCDMFLGVPFNIASYSLLTHMVAHLLDVEVNKFIWIGGDVHVYNNHREQVAIQLARTPGALPKLVIHGEYSTIDDFTLDSFELINYKPQRHIPAPISV